jgi:hypothetical protein
MNNRNSLKESTRQTAEESEGRMAMAYHQVEEAVEQRPLSAVMLSFGIGLGVGFAIAGAIAASQPEPKTRIAQRMGQQFLDAVSRVMPESVAQRIGV